MLKLEQLIRFAKAIPPFGFLYFLLYSLTNTGTLKQLCPSAMTCLIKIVLGTHSLHNSKRKAFTHICFSKTTESRTTIQPPNKDTEAYDKGQSVIKTTKGLLAAKKKNLRMARLARLYSMTLSRHQVTYSLGTERLNDLPTLNILESVWECVRACVCHMLDTTVIEYRGSPLGMHRCESGGFCNN
jgi:hypothetical protein